MSVAVGSASAGGLRGRLAAPAAVLFLCMAAAQASLLVLSPILPAMAADLGVSTATAAQLRSVSGAVAGTFALWIGLRSRPRPLRRLLVAGSALLAATCGLSAAAPSFAVLVVAQVGVGVGLAVVLSSSLAAAGEWSPERQASTLSWALVGQPVAWIVGMPLAGAVTEVSWRYAWLAVPLLASLLALAALALRPPDRAPSRQPDEPSLWRQRGIKGWAVGELLAYGAWAGTLVFAGALFVESYTTSTTVVGMLLAGAAVAYLPGNFLARRWVGRLTRPLLVAGALAASVGVVLFGAVRPGLGWSAALLAGLAFVAGARTIAGSSLGLELAPHCRLQAMSFRTAAVQFGYLLGAGVGGAALAARGYAGLGWALSALFVGAVLPHLPALVGGRPGGTSDATGRPD